MFSRIHSITGCLAYKDLSPFYVRWDVELSISCLMTGCYCVRGWVALICYFLRSLCSGLLFFPLAFIYASVSLCCYDSTPTMSSCIYMKETSRRGSSVELAKAIKQDNGETWMKLKHWGGVFTSIRPDCWLQQLLWREAAPLWCGVHFVRAVTLQSPALLGECGQWSICLSSC